MQQERDVLTYWFCGMLYATCYRVLQKNNKKAWVALQVSS